MSPSGSTTVVRINGVTLSAGDVVLVTPEVEGPDYIAEILRFVSEDGKRIVKIKWFYRPEEVPGGRKVFHGQREVLRSTHVDEIELATVKRKCRVLPLEDFQRLPLPVGEDVFFARYEFDATKVTFSPRDVRSYCYCNTPYNPDMAMAECGVCREWYHNRCIEAREGGPLNAVVARDEPWACASCRAVRAAPGARAEPATQANTAGNSAHAGGS